MAPPRERPEFHLVSSRVQEAIFCQSCFALGARTITTLSLRVWGQGEGDLPAGGRDGAAELGPIDFVNLSVGELFLELTLSLRRFGEENNSRSLQVQPMDGEEWS